MNSADAKRILIAHRAHRADAGDPELAEALQQVTRDPALAEWWKAQQSFHAAMRDGLASAPVPENLREQIRRRTKIVPLPWWQQPPIWAAAAAVVLMAAFVAVFWNARPAGDSFAIFRSRMVSSVLRSYHMDIRTNDMASIRQFLASKRAPADYALPAPLTRLPASGAGVMSWQAASVSMVCLDSGAQGTVFVFVVDKRTVSKPPGPSPELAQVNKLMTASWTKGEKVYVVAIQADAEALKKYL